VFYCHRLWGKKFHPRNARFCSRKFSIALIPSKATLDEEITGLALFRSRNLLTSREKGELDLEASPERNQESREQILHSDYFNTFSFDRSLRREMKPRERWIATKFVDANFAVRNYGRRVTCRYDLYNRAGASIREAGQRFISALLPRLISISQSRASSSLNLRTGAAIRRRSCRHTNSQLMV